MFKVDIFISKGRPFDRQQLSRRQSWAADPDSGRTIYVATPEDTVLTKLAWYRLGHEVSDRQWRDILGVLAVQEGRLDFAYMRQWAASLDVSDLLERVLSESIIGDPVAGMQQTIAAIDGLIDADIRTRVRGALGWIRGHRLMPKPPKEIGQWIRELTMNTALYHPRDRRMVERRGYWSYHK